MVHWSCAPALQQADSAVAEIITRAQRDRAMWPWKVADNAMGSETWLWPALPLLKQKPVDVNLFDPQKRMFDGRGANMPLMMFMPSEIHRTPEANQRRAENAARRGWTQERIRNCRTSTSRASSKNKGSAKYENELATRGGGANDEGKGKDKGKDENKGKGKEDKTAFVN